MEKNLFDQNQREYRVDHVSWWKEEMPSEEEMKEGLEHLSAHHNKVDFILTHCAPTSLQESMYGNLYPRNTLTEYLEQIHKTCDYKFWFFGHYHKDMNVNQKDMVVYKTIIRVV